MHVCVLTSAFDAFKGGNHLPLLSALPDIEFTILTGRCKPVDPELPKNVHIKLLPPYRSGPYHYGFADYRYASAVMAEYPPDHAFWTTFDVLHLNQTMGLPLLRLTETRKPVLMLIHHPVSVDEAVAAEETVGFEHFRWRLRYLLLRRWQARLCKTLPHLATVSETAAARIADDYRCSREKIVVIPNGVDGSVFTPGDLATADFDVVAVGSMLHPRKGFRYLLETYRILGARGYRVADVGRRTEAQQRALASVPNLRMFGMVGHDELLSILRRSATLISASLYEGFGLSLIEALACGRPVFAFDAGATGEVLRPIDPSFVVPIRDSAELADRVLSFLLLSSSERATRGATYRKAVLERYSMAKSAGALRGLYLRVSRS